MFVLPGYDWHDLLTKLLKDNGVLFRGGEDKLCEVLCG